jgi:hypothetical protein
MPIKYLNMITQKAEELLKAGFGVVNTHIPDGIAQGTGALVALNMKTKEFLLANQISNHFSFSRSIASISHPSSLMGMMALLRQMYFDLDWYKKGIKNTRFIIR